MNNDNPLRPDPANPPLPTPPPVHDPEEANSFRDASQKAQHKAGEWSEIAKDRAADFVAAQKRAVDRDPTSALLIALAVGFGCGLLVRFLSFQDEEDRRTVDVKHRPTLDEAKFHLGSVLLPFIWPAVQKARAGYERSAETVGETARKIRKTDLRKVGKQTADSVEEWIEDGVLPVYEKSRKRVNKFFR